MGVGEDGRPGVFADARVRTGEPEMVELGSTSDLPARTLFFEILWRVVEAAADDVDGEVEGV